MKNAQYWMEYLERLAEGQERGTIKAPQAVEMNNTVGKVIALAKACLESQRMKAKSANMMPIPSLEFNSSENLQQPEKDS